MNQNDKKHSPRALGVIGGSCHSAVGYAHFTACQMDQHWQIVSGCFSRNAEHNAQTAESLGILESRVYNSWREYLNAERSLISAVAILTPTPDHAEMVSEALRLGIPVICEKALTTSVVEADQIGAALEQSKGFLAVTFNYTGYPLVRELRYMIERGTLGAISHIQIEMPQEGFMRTNAQGNPMTPQAWRLKDYAIPAISLDLGSHALHLITFLTGALPDEVMSTQASIGNFPGVIDDVCCWVQYQNGMRANMWLSKASLGNRNGLRIRVYGNKASAEWFQMHPEELVLNHANGRRETIDRGGSCEVASASRYTRFKAGHPAGFIEAFANLYADIATSLDEWQNSKNISSPYVPTYAQALQGLAILEAARKAADTRSWQKVTGIPQKQRGTKTTTLIIDLDNSESSEKPKKNSENKSTVLAPGETESMTLRK